MLDPLSTKDGAGALSNYKFQTWKLPTRSLPRVCEFIDDSVSGRVGPLMLAGNVICMYFMN